MREGTKKRCIRNMANIHNTFHAHWEGTIIYVLRMFYDHSEANRKEYFSTDASKINEINFIFCFAFIAIQNKGNLSVTT